MALSPMSPMKPEVNQDAVARAAIERAEKAEAKVKELQALYEKALASSPVSRRNSREAVPGTHTYRLVSPHYCLGRRYEAGELVTVTDAVPGKTWVPVVSKAVVEMVESQVSRPNSQEV